MLRRWLSVETSFLPRRDTAEKLQAAPVVTPDGVGDVPPGCGLPAEREGFQGRREGSAGAKAERSGQAK
jgi:hypothetical protein